MYTLDIISVFISTYEACQMLRIEALAITQVLVFALACNN